MKKPDDLFDWLMWLLFDSHEYWYLVLPLKNGGQDYCRFYRAPWSLAIYPEPLEVYLQATDEERRIIEEEALEMGCQINIAPQPPCQGGGVP